MGRILVVDDNEDLAHLLSELIECLGYEVRFACSGRAALDILQAFEPHLLLTDIGMPGMSGFDLAREVRRRTGCKPLLVSTSGWNDADTVGKAMDAGFRIHIVKPITLEVVSKILHAYVASRVTDDDGGVPGGEA